MGEHDHWQFFNWPEIIREAKLRHAQAVESTAEAMTPEMRTLEYWTAWCAHANAASCLSPPAKPKHMQEDGSPNQKGSRSPPIGHPGNGE